MIAMELPPLPPGDWLASILQVHEIAGRRMWCVTIRGRGGASPVREWFADEDQAYAYGLSQADSRALPFIDLADGGAE